MPQVVSMDDESEEDGLSSREHASVLAEKAFDLMSGKVGVLKSNGDPTDLPDGSQDTEEGSKLMKEAAEGGNKAAQYAVAMHYLQQDNEEECFKWIKLAAHNDHAEAQMTYACQYWLHGRNGHEKDQEQAVIWLRRSLAHGAGENPDPNGHVLSKRSFTNGLLAVNCEARRLCLSEFEEGMFNENVEVTDGLKLAADCGIVPAINLVCGECMTSVVSRQTQGNVQSVSGGLDPFCHSILVLARR